MFRSARAYCAGVSVLFRYAARTPACVSDSTWSCIREISGEITSVTPGSSSAGIW